MFPVGDAWFYGLHVTKVYVSYGNMDDVRHAKSTHGVGHVAKVSFGTSELSSETAKPRVTSVCMAICSITWTTSVAHGGPRSPKCGFSKEKHGFVPCMCENSENH